MSRETDIAASRQMRLLAALLDHDEPPWRQGELPPLGHWLLFPPAARQSAIGADGHPARNDDGLPRRMWAGSRIRFLAPIALNTAVTRATEQISVSDKTGRSGAMRFVTLRHSITSGDTLAIEEEQDIVYRAAANGAPARRPSVPDAAVPEPPVSRVVQADPVALFRYSALTFNGHRIHYDRSYSMGAEGYPGLVVHGPYIATLLMDHYLRHHPRAPVAGFDFRALRPVFDGEPFTLGLTEDAGGADLIAVGAASGTAMQARVDLA